MKLMVRILSLAVVLSGAAPAAASVRSSHSGWFWGSPTPQGESLNAVEFAGGVGFAAGEFGTLLRSRDAGHTWEGIATGLTEDLHIIRMLGARTVVVAGSCAVRRSDDGGNTFRRLPWTASDTRCTSGVAALAFPSAKVGFLALNDGIVLRSGDAGRTWSRRTAVPGSAVTSGGSHEQPVEMDFISDTTGYVATDAGDVYRTTDGGNTWSAVLAEPFPLRTIRFASATVGYAAGNAPFVLKTTDGGASWEEQSLPGDVSGVAQIRCANEMVCEGVSADGDRIVRTVDGGETWDSVAPATFMLRSVGLPSAQQAVAVGVFGITVVSSDAGQTFSPLGGGLFGRLHGVEPVNATTAYAYGSNGALARTTTGGATWQEIDAATSDRIVDVSFASKDSGYVLDTSGQLLRTTNGGDSYEILDTGTAERAQAVLDLGSNRVLLVGPAGVARSVDGRTFRANTQKAVRTTPLFDVDHVGDTVLAYGPSALLLSRNGGQSFRAMRRPLGKRTRVDVVDLVSSRTAYLLDARGFLFRTDDAGRKWRWLPGVGTEVAYAMGFSDASHGWIAISEFGSSGRGWVLRTADGGRTWQPQLVGANAIARRGLGVGDASTAFALTTTNSLFATHVGGAAGRPSALTIEAPKRFRLHKDLPASIRISGRLTGARGGEHVVVSYRERGSDQWLFQDVVVASRGTFTVVARLRTTAKIVAQWAGDDRLRGAGSPALTVVGPRIPPARAATSARP